MIRPSLAAFLSLCLSVGFVAQASDAEPPKHELEAIVVNVMTKAFQVADYDTVEALFGKLSPENKIQFLQEVAEMTLTCQSQMTEEALRATTTVDTMLMATVQAQPDCLPLAIERWAEAKQFQTQLLGRLTLSFFEPAVGATQSPSSTVIPAQAGIQTKDVHTASLDPRLRGGDGKNLYQPVRPAVHFPPSVAPPVAHHTPYQTHGGIIHTTPLPMQQPIVAPVSPMPPLYHQPIQHQNHVPVSPMPPSVAPPGVHFTPDQTHSYVVHLTPPPIPQRQAETAKIVRYYHVGDISGSGPPSPDFMNQMIRTVAPEWWYMEEGATITFDANTRSLVIRQTEEIHTQIEDFFRQLREWKEAHGIQVLMK